MVCTRYGSIVSSRPEAEIFVDLARQGYPVTVMTPPDSPYAPRLEAAGCRVVGWHPATKLGWSDVRRVRRELVDGRHDVMFLMNNSALANGAFAAVGLPVKVVAYRGYDGNVKWSDPTNWWKMLHPRIDAYWGNAESVRETLQAAVPRRREHVVAIPKGHDVRWYDGAGRVDRAALGIPADAFAVVFAANVRPMKGVPDLLRATAHVPPASKLHLVLMGVGMDTPEIQALIAASPMRDRIHVLGSRNDVLEVMRACDGYVCCSLKGESLTKSLMEAMSLGIPAVITDVPGNRGIVLDGVNGRVVPRGDPPSLGRALADLASDPARAKEWGRVARRHIETTWSHDAAVAKMRAFVDRLVADGARAR